MRRNAVKSTFQVGLKFIALSLSAVVALTIALGSVAAQEVSESEIETVMDVMASIDNEVSEGVMSAVEEAAALASGSLMGVGRYQAEGQATLYRLADGSQVLRLEDFSTTNGPDLHLILTSAGDVSASGDPASESVVDLGVIKGNRGNQNYVIPEGTDLSAVTGVVINCNAFSVLWGVAALGQAAAK